MAGVVIGVAGTLYATNEDVRKNLPKAAREFPDNVRHRFETAVSAAREASTRRREEILRDLEAHEAHADRAARPAPVVKPADAMLSDDERDKLAEKTEGGSA